jgi:transcriptional regulator with XRE-family HTH domain
MMQSRTRKRRQFEYLAILELYSRGFSYRQIANKLKVSTYGVSRVLHNLNNEGKEELLNMVANEVPLAYKSTITLLRGIMSECQSILDTSQDPRVKIMALSLQRECNTEINHTLSDSANVAKAVQHVDQSNKAILDNQTSLRTDVALLRDDLKDIRLHRKRKQPDNMKEGTTKE